jgi:acetyltransferase
VNAALPIAGPYPAHLARECAARDGRRILIRPVRPDDEGAEAGFFERLSPDARYTRFQQWAAPITSEHIHAYTHVDYRRHMAFVAESLEAQGYPIVGDARYFANLDGRSCEFGIVVADDWHHTGVAQLLMEALMAAAKAHGLRRMSSTVLRRNRDMLRFAQELGFAIDTSTGDPRIARIERIL